MKYVFTRERNNSDCWFGCCFGCFGLVSALFATQQMLKICFLNERIACCLLAGEFVKTEEA